MGKVSVTPEQLTDIRTAIREIDVKRRDEDLTKAERALLEDSAITLREAERVAVAALQKEVVDGLTDAVTDLQQQSKAIRARVTRMNKTPKALDRIEDVLGYAVAALKAISKWTVCLLLLLCLTATSCGVLTASQVKLVESLAISSDTLTKSPARIFTNLSDVRRDRSLLYAATLTSPEAHFKETVSLSKSVLKDEKQAAKAASYIQALNSYCRALQRLANETRWKQYGTELRGIGRRSDSIVLMINKNAWLDDELTVGWGKLTGKYTALLTEGYMKTRQARAVKEYVQLSDTLVSACVDSLIAQLQSPAVKALIANEQSGLNDDYRAFLDAAARMPDPMTLSLTADCSYLRLYTCLDNTSTMRTKCITALRSFKRAHQRLAAQLDKRSDTSRDELAQSVWDDILQLNTLSAELAGLW